jgi:hypothetical protein
VTTGKESIGQLHATIAVQLAVSLVVRDLYSRKRIRMVIHRDVTAFTCAACTGTIIGACD